MTAPIRNALASCLPGNAREAGNCARWTSGGLVAAGVLGIRRNFPKGIFVQLFESQCRADPTNVHVVTYVPPAHVKRRWPDDTPYVRGPIKPLNFIRSMSCAFLAASP